MDLDRISNLCMSISTEWRDVQIIYKNKKGKDKSLIVPLLITGSNGIYIFIDELFKEDVKEIHQQLEKLFNIRNDGLYLFFYNSDNSNEGEDDTLTAWVYDFVHHEFLELEDLYDAFDVFYYNHYIPQAELHCYHFNSLIDYFTLQEVEIERELELEENDERYIKPIISSDKVEYIEKKLEELLSSGRKEGKYTYYEDGTMTVNKIVRSPDGWKKPWESYMETKTYDYPCSYEEGDKTFLITALGGWFGVHKFRTGKFVQGIFYLLSCGCCCMFYFIDMVAVMTGNYATTNSHYFRSPSGRVEKAQIITYNRPVKNKKLFLLAPIMAIISILLLNYAYLPAYEYGSKAVSSIVQELYEEKINNGNNIKNISGLSDEDFEQYKEILESLETVSTETTGE